MTQSKAATTPQDPRETSGDRITDVVIVGAGFAGLGMALGLVRAGHRDFVILESDVGPGGTWRVNTYPGCACDVPSHLYSFSFRPNPAWSRAFAPQAEILRYLEDCISDYRLTPHIRYETRVTAARWDDGRAIWRVETSDGQTYLARHLVMGLGGLSRPQIPNVKGAADFAGPAFHTARWRHDISLVDQNVAVIGTGASAIQAVPRIAGQVAQLDLYQRTPPWVMPKADRPFAAAEKALFDRVPATGRLKRWATYWQFEARAIGFAIDPRLMALAKKTALKHLEAQVPDPTLRARLTPSYMPGCKRILMANDYYPALSRRNVELHTEAIDHIGPRGVQLADGTFRPADVLIWATGFQVSDLLTPLVVTGRDGRDLNERWADKAEAYLGTMVSGFPNLFVLTGPNTGLGHNSMVFMIESQVQFILSALATRRARGARSVDVDPDVEAAYNRDLQARLAKSVWASGCASWYLDAKGHNSTLWPGFTFDFRRRTRRLDPSEYRWSA